jgi:flagellar export protein FliJ
MKQRVKTVSRITQLIEHQEEALEMQVLQTQNRLNTERDRLVFLKSELQETIDGFNESLKDDPQKVSVQDVAFLYGTHTTLLFRIEEKNNEVALINKVLKDQKALLLEAYQKKKVFEVFKNKMIRQEKREEETGEQRSMDFLNLTRGSNQ